MENVLGSEFYFVDFNRRPGVAEAVFEGDVRRFLRNLFQKDEPSGVSLIDLAGVEPVGEALMGEDELGVYVSAFEGSGFTASVNWYRNFDRNWHLLADVYPIVHQPALMIYGDRDLVPKGENLEKFVPDVEVVSVDCGHWIQQERPEEVNRLIVGWLERQTV